MSGKKLFYKKNQGKGMSLSKGGNSNTSSGGNKDGVRNYNYYLGSAQHANKPLIMRQLQSFSSIISRRYTNLVTTLVQL
jgi:hypothetical protein